MPLASALMAFARKVIVFDFKELSVPYVFATAAVVFSLGITFLAVRKEIGNITNSYLFNYRKIYTKLIGASALVRMTSAPLILLASPIIANPKAIHLLSYFAIGEL